MRSDALLYAPFKEHFSLTIVRTFVSYEAATHLEAHLISQYDTRNAAHGYNTLPSTPGQSEVFWMQHKRRQRQHGN
jgi:hypothetical protein